MRLATDVDVAVGNLAAAVNGVDTQQHCQPPRRASDALLRPTAPDGKIRTRMKVELCVGPWRLRVREQRKGSCRISKEPGIVPHRFTGTYS